MSDKPNEGIPGLTVEVARRLVATEGSIDAAAKAGGWPVQKFRRYCRSAGVKASTRGSWGVSPDDRSGYVYGIRALGQDMVKLGVAKSVDRRLADLQTGSFAALRVDMALFSDDALALEAHLHRHFKKRHHRAEWFRFAEAESVTALLPKR